MEWDSCGRAGIDSSSTDYLRTAGLHHRYDRGCLNSQAVIDVCFGAMPVDGRVSPPTQGAISSPL